MPIDEHQLGSMRPIVVAVAAHIVDLPSQAERKEIFRIHLEKRQRDFLTFDLDELASASAGFSGAEIEQAVVAAMVAAFAEGGELLQQHLGRAVAETLPLSATMSDELARLREWAKPRARRT